MTNKAFNSYSDIGRTPDKDDTLLIFDSSTNTLKEIKVSDLVGGWRDLRFALIGAKTAGVADPTLDILGPSGGIQQYKFAVDDEVFLALHVDHDVKEGSTMFPHVHWATDGTSANIVKWEIEYTIAARTSEIAFPAPTTITIEAAANTTAWAHQVTEHGSGFSAPEIDSLILVHLTRITNGGTENTDKVFGLFFDIHYEAQQYGSENSVSPFYT